MQSIYNNLGINAIFQKFDGDHKTVEGKDNNNIVFRSVCDFIIKVLNNEKIYSSNGVNKTN